MPSLSSLTSIWKSVKEVDLRPIIIEATQRVQLMIVGEQSPERDYLSNALLCDPARPEFRTATPVLVNGIDQAFQSISRANEKQAGNFSTSLQAVDLIILLIGLDTVEDARERELATHWAEAGKRVLVVIDPQACKEKPNLINGWVNWGQRRVIFGKIESELFLQREFTQAVMDLMPDRYLALGRHYPLFRVAIARRLISDTCLQNAVYSISTGLAEIVPVLDIPLNATDMFVLTKSQAFLVYKLGLALGFTTRWQEYVTEFGSVLGGGFVWRQVARSLIGLIPGYGIIPKVAVAYAGTFVVGNVVLQWYLTGRHINNRQMKVLYSQAFVHGKEIARGFVKKLPSFKWKLKIGKPWPALLSRAVQVCPDCGKKLHPNARFCQFCGRSLVQISDKTTNAQ